MANLQALGSNGNILKWKTSYLQSRSQYFKYAGSISSPISVRPGIPQGSHIGPIHFILCVNDMSNVIYHSHNLMFVTDLKLNSKIHSTHDAKLL